MTHRRALGAALVSLVAANAAAQSGPGLGEPIAPGDLAVYAPNSNGVGHIVMIHHVDPDGTARTIEASPSGGVHIGAVEWDRVTSIKRPENP